MTAVMNQLNSLRSCQPQLAELAAAWLADGATSFEIWSHGGPVMWWPDRPLGGEPSLASPLVVGDKVFGELRVGGAAGPAAARRLAAEAGVLAELLAREAELETMTATLLSNQDQVVALCELSSATRGSLEIEQTLEVLTREAARLVQAGAACSLLEVSEGLPIVVHAGEPVLADKFCLALLAAAKDRQQTLMLGPTDHLLRGQATIEHALVEPIRVRGEIVACLVLADKETGPFTAVDRKLVRTLCEQAGAQLEVNLLYQQSLRQERLRAELDLARHVQLHLLPRRVPTVPGLEISAQTRPASEVGGDYLDFIAPPARPFIFAVGDVAGKGVPAALFMSVIRHVIRSAATYMPNPTPGALLRRLNADLYDDFTDVGMFATVFIGLFNPGARELHYASAGQSPVILRSAAGGALRLLEAEDVPVGVLPVMTGRECRLELAPGDLLIVATDGFSEARNADGEFFGNGRLLELAEAAADQSPDLIANTLFATVERFASGGQQPDDQTLAVIRFIGE